MTGESAGGVSMDLFRAYEEKLGFASSVISRFNFLKLCEDGSAIGTIADVRKNPPVHSPLFSFSLP